MPLALVLADMETVGFRIDRQGIAAYGEQLGRLAEGLEARIYMQAGVEFNIHSPKQLGEVLFDTLGLPHNKKTKTGYSTNAEVLEKLRPYHPIVQDILDYRQVTKLKSTYADGLLKVADANGRVHSTFKQTGTATGRLSSTDPNLPLTWVDAEGNVMPIPGGKGHVRIALAGIQLDETKLVEGQIYDMILPNYLKPILPEGETATPWKDLTIRRGGAQGQGRICYRENVHFLEFTFTELDGQKNIECGFVYDAIIDEAFRPET